MCIIIFKRLGNGNYILNRTIKTLTISEDQLSYEQF